MPRVGNGEEGKRVNGVWDARAWRGVFCCMYCMSIRRGRVSCICGRVDGKKCFEGLDTTIGGGRTKQ